MRGTFETYESTREFDYDERQVVCPNASTLGTGRKVARVGDWVSFNENGRSVNGRMLGRCLRFREAPHCIGHLVVAVLSDDATFGYIRFPHPNDVQRIVDAPTQWLRWIAQETLPPLPYVVAMAAHGTLCERFIAEPDSGPRWIPQRDMRKEACA